jgi:hypothetical protein
MSAPPFYGLRNLKCQHYFCCEINFRKQFLNDADNNRLSSMSALPYMKKAPKLCFLKKVLYFSYILHTQICQQCQFKMFKYMPSLTNNNFNVKD